MAVKKVIVRKKIATSGKRKVAAEIYEGKNRMLSDLEKRELILAHIAKRKIKTRDPLQVASLYAGVAVTSLVVILGWVYAFSPSILQAVKNPFTDANGLFQVDELKNVSDQAKKQSEESDLSRILKQTTAELDRVSEQRKKERAVFDRLVESVSSTVQTEGMGGFSNPIPAATSSTAVKKATTTTILE